MFNSCFINQNLLFLLVEEIKELAAVDLVIADPQMFACCLARVESMEDVPTRQLVQAGDGLVAQ